MAYPKIHLDSTGRRLTVKVYQYGLLEVADISSAITLQIIIERPNGTTTTKTASFDTDGTDGLFGANIEAGDLTVVGAYSYYGRYSDGSIDEYTSRKRFDVYE